MKIFLKIWLTSARNGVRKWLKSAAEATEELMDKYLEEGDLSEEDIKAGIRQRCIDVEIVPMFCGSAFKNKGVQALLDAVIDVYACSD